MARKPRTVLEFCVLAHGVHRGAVAAAHTAQWIIATHDLGHFPTTVEYADYWAVDERTGWRHRAQIAAALGPDWMTAVQKLADGMGDSRSPRAVMKLAVA